MQEIDKQTHDFISRTVKEMAVCEGVDEALKAINQMEWALMMNSTKASVEEIVLNELING